MRLLIRLCPSALLLLVGCASAFDVYEVPKNRSSSFGEHVLFYALPETIVTVDAAVEKTSVEDGPCKAFLTKDFLGVEPEELFPGGARKPSAKVVTVAIGSRAEPDPDRIFAIKLSRRWYQKLTSSFALSEAGVLTGADMSVENQAVDFAVTTLKTVAGLAVKTGVVTGATTLSGRSLTPEEQKCKEVQREIEHLRDVKRQIIDGSFNLSAPPDGPTINTMLEKIGQTEAILVSKFLGATTVTAGTVHCEWIPGDTDYNIYQDLFEVAKDGIAAAHAQCRVPPDLKSALANGDKKVKLEIKTNRTDQLAGIADAAAPTRSNPSGLVYRIPATSDINVMVGDDSKAFDRRPVAQLGVVTALPRSADVATFQSTVKAALYPGTGAMQKLDFAGTPQGTGAVTGIADAATTILDARAAAAKAEAEAEAKANDELARLERMRKILEERQKIRDLGGDPDAPPQP